MQYVRARARAKLLAEARTQAHGLLVEARTTAEKERALAMEKTMQEQQQLLERARREFNAGNVYFNRGITGAIVRRQPFGRSLDCPGLGRGASIQLLRIDLHGPEVLRDREVNAGGTGLVTAILSACAP